MTSFPDLSPQAPPGSLANEWIGICYASTARRKPFPDRPPLADATGSTCLCPRGLGLSFIVNPPNEKDEVVLVPTGCTIQCPERCPYLYGAANDCFLYDYSKPGTDDNINCTKVGSLLSMPECHDTKRGRCGACINGVCTKCSKDFSGPNCESTSIEGDYSFYWARNFVEAVLDLQKIPIKAAMLDQIKEMLDDIGPETCLNAEFSDLLNHYQEQIHSFTEYVKNPEDHSAYQNSELAMNIAVSSQGMFHSLITIFNKCMNPPPPPDVATAIDSSIIHMDNLYNNPKPIPKPTFDKYYNTAGSNFGPSSFEKAVVFGNTQGSWTELTETAVIAGLGILAKFALDYGWVAALAAAEQNETLVNDLIQVNSTLVDQLNSTLVHGQD
jgi:hypothetical protein